ncbi:MAG: DNA polymerase I [Patescibacteria group bacterium]
MSAHKKTFLILDGNALLHRAWHALPQSMTTSDGTVVNAVYGFTSVVEKMRQTLKPDYMAVAWDLPGLTFRHELFKEYKATRVKKEQALYDQIPIIQELLNLYGIPSISAKGFEADDIIGTIAMHNKKIKDLETLIVTGDRDTLQLIDERTKVLFFVKGVSETKQYGEREVTERFGLDPTQLNDLKALMGDASDNIAGVAGIGEKGAMGLVQTFGSVEGIFQTLKKDPEKIKLAWRAKLEGQKEHALAMKKLVTIVCDVPFKDFELNDAVTREPDLKKLVEKFRQLEFRTFLKKYEGTEATEEHVSQSVGLEHLETHELAIAVEVQAEDLFGGRVKAVALFDGKKMYTKEHPSEKDLIAILEVLKKAKRVVAHDFKLILQTLRPNFSIFQSFDFQLFDTLVAAYLLNSSGRGYEFATLAQKHLGHRMSASPTVDEIVMLLPELSGRLERQLKETNTLTLAQDVEMPLVTILYEMEATGVKLNTTFLKKLSEKLHDQLDVLTKKIYKMAGREFNVNSPLQLADVLFKELKLSTKNIKKTKTGLSTGIDELAKLEELHPIVKLIMQYRELAKLVSTYVDALPKLVAKDGRLHTTFNQTVTATGRLSSSDPNLQNIPVRTEAGREIRKAFVAEAGNVLLSADYSQIELRIVAIIAKDKSFIEAFEEGADIHTRTASEVWGVKENEVTKEQRYAAKAINFGILYGMGARSLAKSTNLSQSDAREFLDKYFELHPAIHNYIEATKQQAHEDGYVETLFGRRRYLPEIHTGVQMLVAQAERMAVNMPMQGTQADIIKMAMIKVMKWIKKDSQARLLLQVHDELVFEVDEKQAKKIGEEIRNIMSNVVKLDVPLVVDIAIGKNWGEL